MCTQFKVKCEDTFHIVEKLDFDELEAVAGAGVPALAPRSACGYRFGNMFRAKVVGAPLPNLTPEGAQSSQAQQHH